jgi:hypothetical protein
VGTGRRGQAALGRHRDRRDGEYILRFHTIALNEADAELFAMPAEIAGSTERMTHRRRWDDRASAMTSPLYAY